MEALLLILGEIVFALLAPLVAVVVDVIAAIFAFLLSLIPSRRKETRERSVVGRRIMIALFALAAVIVGSLALINLFFFDNAVRMVFDTLERKSGIETRCAEIDGSVFLGKVELGGCTIVRRNHPSADFDLALRNLEVDLQLTSLLGTATLQSAYVSGIAGTVARKAPGKPSDDTNLVKPRRAFVIEDLRIDDVELFLSGVNKDGAPFKLPIYVASASSKPLRSRYALFDSLFRSNAAGTIAGADFEVRTAGDPDARQTAWRASAVPVASLGAVTGGALSWFRNGVVDVHVDDEWSREGPLQIDMDWRLTFRDIEVEPPDTTGALTRFATGPIVAYVNARGGDFPFEFGMTINEDQFEYKASLAAAGLWNAVAEAVNKVLASIGIDPGGSASDTADKMTEESKSLLDRLRRPKEEEE